MIDSRKYRVGPIGSLLGRVLFFVYLVEINLLPDGNN